MNKILKLKGTIYQKNNISGGGPANIPPSSSITSKKINTLKKELQDIKSFWEKQSLGFKPLVSIYYIKVVAKSNRVGYVFSQKGISSNESIVGARFSDESDPKHVITHCIPLAAINNTINSISEVERIIDESFKGEIDYSILSEINLGNIKLPKTVLTKTNFACLVKDLYYVDSFKLPTEQTDSHISGPRMISLFDTGMKYSEIVKRLNLKNKLFEHLDDHTWLLTPDQYEELYQKAPYLISMSLTDWRDINYSAGIFQINGRNFNIPSPTNEPTIGVLDTLFSENVYFHEWVEYQEMIDENLINKESYHHGTSVTSLIVDGPSLNPYLDDGCGRFRVRHFGIAQQGRNSATDIIRKIKAIVLSNKDIKVWNISLGSEMQVLFDSISPEAAILDQLQYENDIIFVIAGTNNNNTAKYATRIGAPADSINSVVVNSVKFSGQPAEYSRSGPVLCFFNKPDVSTFGGDKEDRMIVFSDKGLCKESGTSFAAPWVTRKIAYLIYILKYPREVAKALIIDSACGWNTNTKMQSMIGYGRVPTHINDIINTPDDEIKFTIYGTSEKYDSYAYNIPVPKVKDKFPYVAKATLAYFPKCSRNQGVDYTDTELDIHFGRMTDKGKIKSIDNNMQGEEQRLDLKEASVRHDFRKWDNVKHISEGLKTNNRSKKVYTRIKPTGAEESLDNWGISIKTKERLEAKSGQGIHFGLVITLKEIDGRNRISDFIQRCRSNNWFVEEVDADVMVSNYVAAEAEINFED